MKSEVILFQFHTHQVRILPHEDGVSFWVVAKDITDILGYRMASDVLRRVPDKHKGTRSVRTPGGEQQMLCIDEAGLYRLVLRSDKPEAEPFMEWVTAEVLPSIRRTGGYGSDIPKIGDGPLTLAQFEQLQTALQEAHAALMAAPVIVTGAELAKLRKSESAVGAQEHAPMTLYSKEIREGVYKLAEEGWTPKDIAEHFKMPVDSVQTMLYRARKAGRLQSRVKRKAGGAA